MTPHTNSRTSQLPETLHRTARTTPKDAVEPRQPLEPLDWALMPPYGSLSSTKSMKSRNTEKWVPWAHKEPHKMIQNLLKPPPWLPLLDLSCTFYPLFVRLSVCLSVLESFCCLGLSVDRSLWTSHRRKINTTSLNRTDRGGGIYDQWKPVRKTSSFLFLCPWA